MNEVFLFIALFSALAAGIAFSSRKELKLRPVRVRRSTNRRSR